MSITEQAKSELDLINFGAEDTEAMMKIMRIFFDTWDSGGAVAAVFPILQKCISGKPLSPLTGADSEWNHVGDDDKGPVFQNNRCSTVFKDGDGRCYDIDTAGRPTITFPYDPGNPGVRWPIYEITT